jgi:hypothetical protein
VGCVIKVGKYNALSGHTASGRTGSSIEKEREREREREVLLTIKKSQS